MVKMFRTKWAVFALFFASILSTVYVFLHASGSAKMSIKGLHTRLIDRGGAETYAGNESEPLFDDQPQDQQPFRLQHQHIIRPLQEHPDVLHVKQIEQLMQKQGNKGSQLVITSPARRLTPEEVRQRFETRLETLKEGCRSHSDSAMFRRLQRQDESLGPYWPAMNTSLRFCGIEKTASTTWKTVFSQVHSEMKKRGIYQTTQPASQHEINTGSGDAQQAVRASDGAGALGVDSQIALPDTIRFLFVREPYSRLLSAYVDKLFCPNTLFWNHIGKYVIANFRKNATENSLRCGHDITFAELVKYFIHSQKTGLHRDGHFIPTHDHCNLCRQSYHYIGLLETISDDMRYILNVSKVPVSYPENFSVTSIQDNAGWVLRAMVGDILKCMSKEEATLRLWKKFQIRGFISKTEEYPLTHQQAQTVTFEQFVKMAEAAHNRSVQSFSKEGLSEQKTEALQEAFAGVPLEDREKLKNLLFLDFRLFGFDPNLPAVFDSATDHKSEHDDNGYSYFDLSSLENQISSANR